MKSTRYWLATVAAFAVAAGSATPALAQDDGRKTRDDTTRPDDDDTSRAKAKATRNADGTDEDADERDDSSGVSRKTKPDSREDAAGRGDSRGGQSRANKLKSGKVSADDRGTDANKKKKKNKAPKKKNKAPKKKTDPAKKKAKKKKEPKESLTYGLGLKVGVMPYNSMTARPVEGSNEIEYDMKMTYGWGIGAEYRIMPSFYLTGEMMYWYPEIDSVTFKKDSYSAKTSDGLLNLGAGLKINVYGGDTTTDRVYIRGTIGFTDYIADDLNATTTGDGNRIGMYYGGSVGIEHLLSQVISLYADSGFYWNSFNSAAENEADAVLFNWQATAGFFVHWN
jgi:hypothetical protein